MVSVIELCKCSCMFWARRFPSICFEIRYIEVLWGGPEILVMSDISGIVLKGSGTLEGLLFFLLHLSQFHFKPCI